MIYRVEEGKLDLGVIGYQTSSHYYTFSHWKRGVGFMFYEHKALLKYKPIGPTILVRWGRE